jgi:anhydro-N-acetylmuramic acid kinase
MPAPSARVLFIGLMSGTSLDGIDAVLADCSAPVPRTLAHHHLALPGALRDELLALNVAGADEIHRGHVAAQVLARTYAQSVEALLARAGTPATAIRAIGTHGQTVRHRPDLGYTVQLNAPALLAELTGIDVVADFRSRDIAAGGQGAPLAPGFHQVAFGGAAPRAVVNIGGIANVTAVGGGATIGFDTGPGNVLIDAWMAAKFAAPYDVGGALAATAEADEALVAAWMDHPYFTAAPPKSTGRDLFTLDWVLRAPRALQLPPAVVLASLTELTARSIGAAIVRWVEAAEAVVVCGGGARNLTLMQALQRSVGAARPVSSSDALGVPADQVEALAFAWLAHRHLERAAGNLPGVTGARGPRVLGALYPA